MQTKREAAVEVFNLTKKIDQYARAGDVAEVARLQLQISELQRKHGAMTGIGKDENDERSAN
jgi:hypothetical protein